MEFIDQDTKWLNTKLIHDNFSENEAHTIRQIPLSLMQAMDSLVWRGTTNGMFSIKSVYHMENELQAIRRSGSSREGTRDSVWKIIWNLKIPNAVKIFMWKACNDLLPTKVNLLRRGVVSDSLCLICLRR
jgi:hypothetical protein